MTMVVLPAAAIAATAAVPWVTSSRLLKEDANPASRLLMPLGRPMASGFAQHLRLFQGRTWVNRQHRAVFDDVAQVAGSRHKIAQHTGGSRTADTKVQHQNKQRIKNAVDQRAQKITDHALIYCALCTHAASPCCWTG
ncbi:hypothetical protein ACKXF4_06970 [Faecalibacterium prausnitzii]|uniref:hypothetical protein n=1 Tax=Faecalibacterium prausnitzii TaxID=853 RepID=UPI003AAD761C